MIQVEGRIAPGLDEFMLRLGHLSALAHVASFVTRRFTRLERDFAEFISRPTAVSEEMNCCVADYLNAKNLCPSHPPRQDGRKERSEYRYPDLEVFRSDPAATDCRLRVRSKGDGPVAIWWQDFCLSSPEMESCVGAVTSVAKSGSSTGASHIVDWGLILGLLNRDMSPSVECQILARLRTQQLDSSGVNPYLLLSEDRIILSYLFLRADLDLFIRFAGEILTAPVPIAKTTGARLFGAAVKTLSEDADRQRNISHRAQVRIFEQEKELKRAQRKKKESPLGSSSTAWHRASSRLECYVDLGFLKKRNGENDTRFQYIYYPTSLLASAYNSLQTATSAQEWLEGPFIDLYGGAGKKVGALETATVRDLLQPIVLALGRPIKLFPIDALSIGLCVQARSIGVSLSIGGARQSLESLARTQPNVARLSRGAVGERAEFVSLDLNKF